VLVIKPIFTLFKVSEFEASWIGSLMPLAGLVGSIIGGPLLEALGRKTTILLTAIPFVVAGLLVTFAQDVYMIYAGRSLTGFCIGIVSLSMPVYLAETIHPEVRGTLGLLPTTFGNGGVMLCYVLGFWLNWSYLALVSAILPLPFLILMITIPETPRYLISQNKAVEARSSLQWLRGAGYDISMELSDMEQMALIQKKSKLKLKDLFGVANVRPFIISAGLMLFQQFSGINAVMFYSVSIFEKSGSSIDPNMATIILGVVNICATVVANALIDRVGRKVLLYVSDAGMILSLGVFGAYFYMKDVARADPPGWVPLVALMVYVVCFSVGFGPIPWLMMGEVFPARIRGAAASLATAFNWACTFLVTKTFMDLQMSLGAHGAFWLFACICVASVFFIIFFVPETQGKTLEEIENMFKPEGEKVVFSRGQRTRRISSIANLKITPSQLL